MRLSVFFYIIFCCLQLINGQPPAQFVVAGVVRDEQGKILSQTSIDGNVKLLLGSPTGTVIFEKQFNTYTSKDGFATYSVAPTTQEIDTLDWGKYEVYLKFTARKYNEGNYQVVSLSKILSVPYAFYAKTTSGGFVLSSSASGDTMFLNDSWVIVPGLSAANPPPPVYCTTSPTVVQEVTGAGGATWMDRNLGASQVATSSTDTASYGDYYAWGRYADGHQCRNSELYNTSKASTPAYLQGNDWDGKFILTTGNWLVTSVNNLWEGLSAVNNPCPSGFRIPTEAEWTLEASSWTPTTAAGAFASPLKLPLPGFRMNSTGVYDEVGINGQYWTSTAFKKNQISQLYYSVGSTLGGFGMSIRCIKD